MNEGWNDVESSGDGYAVEGDGAAINLNPISI